MHSITHSATDVHPLVSPLDVDSRRRQMVRDSITDFLSPLPDGPRKAYLLSLVEADLLVAEANDAEFARLLYQAAKPSTFETGLTRLLDADGGSLESEGIRTRVLPQDTA